MVEKGCFWEKALGLDVQCRRALADQEHLQCVYEITMCERVASFARNVKVLLFDPVRRSQLAAQLHFPLILRLRGDF